MDTPQTTINIFVYGDEDAVRSIGYRTYKHTGSCEEIQDFLRLRVYEDHKHAVRQPLHAPIDRVEFYAMDRLNSFAQHFVKSFSLPPDSIYCLTHIIDDEPAIDEVHDINHQETFPDYLDIYMTDRGFDFTRLINDDFLDAGRLLWKNRKYISALKLVLSMIDTLSFIEYGPVRDSFTQWLRNFCDMESLGVTPEELWELRNSLLHMTNLDSHKVRRKKIARLLPVIASKDAEIPISPDDFKNLHVSRLIAVVVPRGIKTWIGSYNSDPEKYVQFIYRYDTVVSEARLGVGVVPA